MILAERETVPRWWRQRLAGLGARSGSEEGQAQRVALSQQIASDDAEARDLAARIGVLLDQHENSEAAKAGAALAAHAVVSDVQDFGAFLKDAAAHLLELEARRDALRGSIASRSSVSGLGEWDTPLDAATAVEITFAQYDQTRRRWYEATGSPRDDFRWPKFVPPGASLVKVQPTSGCVGLCFTEDRPDLDFTTSPDAPRAQAWPPGGDYESWWYLTPFGQQRFVFVPPFVAGQYGWEPVTGTPLPLDMQFVCVPHPDPYVVGRQEPLRTITLTSCRPGEPCAPHEFGIYRAPVILTGQGDRQGPRWNGSCWSGGYVDPTRTEWWQDALATVARSSALNALLSAAVGVLTVGTGAPLVAAALEAAAAAGLPVAALPVASIDSPMSALAPSSPVQFATSTFSPVGAPSPASSPIEAVVESVSPAVVPAVATPDESNKVLYEAAQAAVYLSMLGPLADLPLRAFRELVIQAQTTRQAMDGLRLQLDRLEAELNQEAWFKAVKIVATALTIIAGVAAGAFAGAEAAAMIAGLKATEGAASAGLRLADAKEYLRIQRAEKEQEYLAQRQKIEGEISNLEQLDAEAKRRGTPTKFGWKKIALAAGLVLLAGGGAGLALAGRKSRAR